MAKLKQNIRWILPLVLVVIVAVYFVVGHTIGAHAAEAIPNAMWGGR